MNLKEMNVIVTGAASGLGRCFALNLAQAGAGVVAFDMNKEGLDALEAESDRIVGFVGSVTSEDDVKASVQTCVEKFGAVHGVVNNAGIFRDGLLVRVDRKTGELHTMSLDDWNAVIDVDLTGPFLFAREVAAQMIRDNNGGVIVNISSCSRHGNRGQSNYSAAKAGLVADTKLWGEELAKHGIRVGAVAPGFVQTPILDGMRPEMLEKMVSKVPLGRVAKPEEIFQAVRFIFECDYFTGRCIDVDGGITM
ncbi:SDR family oxidoreductase [Microvenator marinus]|uniref:SDR family oxidoreductase n=1 Tax=Microvenator marinus TaxID=2600177 RepID=A0A5B8XV97_9DELT|nr:SDR family oxidoreductase [Microvenator marinus]QED27369.1 SDR family oxidoreductase [Microvenator marinus]